MSDKMHCRYEDTNPVVAAVNSATVIEIGDLVYQDTDNAKPASMMPMDAGAIEVELPMSNGPQRVVIAKPQDAFSDNFLGVAMQPSRSGYTGPIRVATTGVFEFDCPSGTFELGDLVGVDSFTHPRICLANQQVAPVNDAKYAIARVAKRVAIPATSVLVAIRSTVMSGGIISRD